MNIYTVSMPFAGTVTKSIEANSEEEAIDNFLNNAPNLIDRDIEVEWDYYEHLTEGNVIHVWNSDVTVELEYEDEEDIE